MSSRHRRLSAAADRLSRLEVARKELAEAAGLDVSNLTPDTKIRLEHAAWGTLALGNSRAAILSGEQMDITAIERLVTALNDLLPKASPSLTVHLVYTCYDCAKQSAPTPLDASNPDDNAPPEVVADRARRAAAARQG